METILKLIDRKGDKGNFSAKGADDLSTEIVTFLTGKTHCGGSYYSTVETGVLASPLTKLDTEVPNNDIDYKAVILLKNLSDPQNQTTKRVVIPAPIINVVNGICSVLSGEEAQIPPVPPAGGVGKGGNTIATEYETMVGATAGDYVFLSGGFIKNRR